MNYTEVRKALANNEPFRHGDSMSATNNASRFTTCADCGKSNIYEVFSYRTLIFTECNECGLRWTNPMRYSNTTTRQHFYIRQAKGITKPLITTRKRVSKMNGTINGHALDESALAPQFAPYHVSGQRIIVKFSYGETKRGYVGKTTGWKPSYLLMATTRSTGSSDLLGHDDVIIGTVEKWRY